MSEQKISIESAPVGSSRVSSTPTSSTKRLDVLEQTTKRLEKRAEDVEQSLVKSERQQDRTANFVMGISGLVIVGFFLAIIPLLFDYYRDNAIRYENFTRRIDNLDCRVNILEHKRCNAEK